ncbi:hypothetical protein BD413DRAFT_615387 [Trametes elegans]|nr:hypothetical protein BD413DRAFT_615387 [Trametes elegans]
MHAKPNGEMEVNKESGTCFLAVDKQPKRKHGETRPASGTVTPNNSRKRVKGDIPNGKAHTIASQTSSSTTALAPIDVDNSASSSEDELNRAKTTVPPWVVRKTPADGFNEPYNEDGEEGPCEAHENDVDELSEDGAELRDGAIDNADFCAEAVVFSGRAVFPVEERVQSSPPPKHPSRVQNRTRKLVEEMPVVKPAKPRTDAGSLGNNGHDISSALQTRSRNTYLLKIKGLGREMNDVVHHAFTKARLFLTLGYGNIIEDPEETSQMPTPVGLKGIELLALEALIAAAEERGYDSQYDIADRLERGDEQLYVMPLVRKVQADANRYRNAIRQAIAKSYIASLGLHDKPASMLTALVESNNFLFPIGRDDKRDYAQPFRGPGIVEAVRDAFFSDIDSSCKLGMQNVHSLTSSLPSAPHELEIPDFMLAMVACAINATIRDVAAGRPDDSVNPTEFASTYLEGLFRGYMRVLVSLRQKNLPRYHALMHDICMAASRGRAMQHHSAVTQAQIVSSVDWSRIVQ